MGDHNEKRERALADVKLYLANDWQLKEETPEYFLLTRSKTTFWGHFWVAVFTCWTLGLGNWFYARTKRETKKIVK